MKRSADPTLLPRSPQMFSRHLQFIGCVIACMSIYWASLKRLISFSLTYDYASHILLVPLLALLCLYLKRRSIFSAVTSEFVYSGSLVAIGVLLAWVGRSYSLSGGTLWIRTLSFIILLFASFVFAYGTRAFWNARFPLCFLFFMLPLPSVLIDRSVSSLQVASSDVAYILFRSLNVPVFRDGFTFLLPGISIEIAEQCSGIRSSLVLLITAVLLGEFALRSFWAKSFIVLCTLPLLVFKNAIRIVSISLLSIYVDPGFLHGWLHTSGGIVFYILGVLIVIFVIALLKTMEQRTFHHHPSATTPLRSRILAE